MKTKKVLTPNLKPGMVSSEAAYTFTNHLVIQSNTTLTPEIIDKLKYYAIKSIKVYVTEEEEGLAEQGVPVQEEKTDADFGLNLEGPTYFERIQQTEHFMEFKENFTSSVSNFKEQLNDIVVKNSSDVVDDMLAEVDSILARTRNPLHLLDMMQCLRGFDDMTYMHSMNVALICNVIGSWVGLPEDEMRVLIVSGLLHDIGKLKIPQEIITKPGKLTDEEFEMIRSHPKLGYDILRSKDLDNRIKLAALQHHERYNGSGYPRQLTGPEISNFSSIVAIADVYDAMTSNRAYRKGICPFTVIATLEKEKDLYEPSLLYLFMKRTIEAYVNTEVLLSNGERGKVVLLNQNLLSRPVVITDNKTYDLSRDFSVEISALI
ncbi:MAG: HD-GYP domain-containing protein [Butyribacter sp.]|nr:HD-GYP domain-containing protein [bacterium]MDY3854093.1 HD-GYP domain-containing protein [Butyribacter sp.]